jgi:hypothetical protein
VRYPRRLFGVSSIREYSNRLETIEFLVFKTVVFLAGLAFILQIAYKDLYPFIHGIWALFHAP